MSRAMMTCMLATSLAVSVGCSAQAPRAIAQKLYDQLDQATANQDLDRILGFVDSSYVLTDQRSKRVEFAEFRRDWEHAFPLLRRINPSTTVQDVQLEAGRMVVNYKTEWHFELLFINVNNNCWVPEILKRSGSATWERKGDRWKVVRSTTLSEDTRIDPNWDAYAAARSASRLSECAVRDPVHPRSCSEINPPLETLCKYD